MSDFASKKGEADWKRRNTVPGYIRDMFNRAKYKAGLRNIHWDIESWEVLFEMFQEHVKRYGMTCPYSGEQMVIYRYGKKGINPQNVSLDRLDNTKGYTKQNCVFTTVDMNLRKAAVTIDDCKNILRVYNERNQ